MRHSIFAFSYQCPKLCDLVFRQLQKAESGYISLGDLGHHSIEFVDLNRHDKRDSSNIDAFGIAGSFALLSIVDLYGFPLALSSFLVLLFSASALAFIASNLSNGLELNVSQSVRQWRSVTHLFKGYQRNY